MGRLITRSIERIRLLVARRSDKDPDRLDLSESDLQQLTAAFQAHATAVQVQVSRYADTLADGDPELRARLRQFEGGGGS